MLEFICIADAGIEDFWTNTLRKNLLLLKRSRIREDREWDRVRYLAWSSGNFGKGKKPKDLFELNIDKMYVKKATKDVDRATKSFEKYRKIYESKSEE